MTELKIFIIILLFFAAIFTAVDYLGKYIKKRTKVKRLLGRHPSMDMSTPFGIRQKRRRKSKGKR